MAYRRGVEFVDLLDGLSWPARAILYRGLILRDRFLCREIPK